jgi:hypothetical protein
VVSLTAIFVGVIPIMAGAVLSTGSELRPIAVWLVGISPVSLPFYAAGTLLPIADLPEELARAVPQAFYFWVCVALLVTLWLSRRLWTARKAMADNVRAAPPPR